MTKNFYGYIAVLFFSVMFLVVGNMLVRNEPVLLHDYFEPSVVFSARVTQIIDRVEERHFDITNTYVHFYARVTSGDLRGETIQAVHTLTTFSLLQEREVRAGDRILLAYDDFQSRYLVADFMRINYVIILGIVFLAFILLFGKTKGFNSVLSLGLICMSIFFVFIPAILAGRNIYLVTFLICLYVIYSTLLIVIGVNKKAFAASLGCLGGVVLAGLLMRLMDVVMVLTGFVDHETPILLRLPLENPIDFRALVFASVTLGAVGAIMDVAMSISSSLWELKQTGGITEFGSIFKSGINIGGDILGTMLNTLILAYIGSSLSMILLIAFHFHTTSYMELFNSEMIAVEILRALVGSFGMLLAIPLTAGVCGWMYSSEKCVRIVPHEE